MYVYIFSAHCVLPSTVKGCGKSKKKEKKNKTQISLESVARRRSLHLQLLREIIHRNARITSFFLYFSDATSSLVLS